MCLIVMSCVYLCRLAGSTGDFLTQLFMEIGYIKEECLFDNHGITRRPALSSSLFLRDTLILCACVCVCVCLFKNSDTHTLTVRSGDQ